jgi:hypothetical protein
VAIHNRRLPNPNVAEDDELERRNVTHELCSLFDPMFIVRRKQYRPQISIATHKLGYGHRGSVSNGKSQ